MFAFTRLDHVLLAIPPGSEESCRPFYVGLLGMVEEKKPPLLDLKGGLWLRGGGVVIHLGVEKDHRPARKAHPGICIAGLDALAKRLTDAGCDIRWDDEDPSVRRFFVHDPVGNRLEFIDAGTT